MIHGLIWFKQKLAIKLYSGKVKPISIHGIKCIATTLKLKKENGNYMVTKCSEQ